VLVVEDEPTLARVYTRALVAAGFEVDHAPDGAAGLERLLAGNYAAVVSDVCMPRLSGLDLLERVQQLAPGLPVVLMTAQLDPEAYARARDLGSVRYLLKPVRMAQLVNAVQSAVMLGAAWARTEARRTSKHSSKSPSAILDPARRNQTARTPRTPGKGRERE